MHSSKHTLNKFLFLLYIHWKSFSLFVGCAIVYIKLQRQRHSFCAFLNSGENVRKNDIYAHYFQYPSSYSFLGTYIWHKHWWLSHNAQSFSKLVQLQIIVILSLKIFFTALIFTFYWWLAFFLNMFKKVT